MFKTSPILVSPIPILISSSSYHPVSFFFLQPFNLLGFLIKGFTFTISRYSHSLLDPLLSDFQPYHFSETACIKITNEVCVIRSNNFFSNLILFSLVATFDTSTIPFILKCFHSLNSVLYNIPVFLLHVCLFLLVYFVRSSLPSHSFNIGRLFLFYRCNFIQSHGLGSHLYDDLQSLISHVNNRAVHLTPYWVAPIGYLAYTLYLACLKLYSYFPNLLLLQGSFSVNVTTSHLVV